MNSSIIYNDNINPKSNFKINLLDVVFTGINIVNIGNRYCSNINFLIILSLILILTIL